MTMMMRLQVCCLVVSWMAGICAAQETPPRPAADSTMVFGTMKPSVPAKNEFAGPLKAWGIDMLISNGGFGLGSFYRREYSDEISGFIDFSISEAKDDDEKDFVDYYGRRFTPGKVNRFLVLPLYVGIQKRMFKDDIMDNFRPYINAAAGPAMIYVFPNDDEYFAALGHGRPKYTIGGYFGFGAYFGSERSNVLGINLRYYIIPYPGGVESLVGVTKSQFGGFFITINFGSSWQ